MSSWMTVTALFILGVIVIGLWVVPIGLSYQKATEKGYEPMLGILLGFFLGWIGFLITLALSPRQA